MTEEWNIQDRLAYILETSCTPEEACAECLDLLPKVCKRLAQIRRVESQLDMLFPASISNVEQHGKVNFSVPIQLPEIEGYEVTTVLGFGGIGVVYTARHLKLNRIVALKMLLAGHYASPQEVKRFVRESQAVARLQHPNIVQVYDVGDLGGRPYFTMEFVNGGSLAEDLSGSPQLSSRAAEMIFTLAKAVQSTHNKGIIHRDLKPANILLSIDGIPKIADFGLARQLDVLRKLAVDIPIEGQSVALLVLIGQRIYEIDGDEVSFLKRVQRVYPEDFWVNLLLGSFTQRKNPAESVRYFQAAIAIRPSCSELL